MKQIIEGRLERQDPLDAPFGPAEDLAIGRAHSERDQVRGTGGTSERLRLAVADAREIEDGDVRWLASQPAEACRAARLSRDPADLFRLAQRPGDPIRVETDRRNEQDCDAVMTQPSSPVRSFQGRDAPVKDLLQRTSCAPNGPTRCGRDDNGSACE